MSPKLVDKKLKRQELIEAAVAVFSAKGFQKASMGEIAVRANIGKGTIYEYFKSKEALFYSCFDWFEKKTLYKVSDTLTDCDSAVDKLHKAARVMVKAATRYIEFYPLTLEVWAMASTGMAQERFADRLRESYRVFRRVIETILREGQASGDFRHDIDVVAIAALLTGAFDGAILQSWFDRSINIEQYMNRFMDIVVRGLKSDVQD
jgi:AcrR family transcriptional regulator